MSNEFRNSIDGFAAIIIAAAIAYGTSGMPEEPAGFPRLIAAGFGICGLVLVAKSLLRLSFAQSAEQNLKTDIDAPESRSGKLVLTIALMWLAMLLAASKFGFLLPGFIFLVISSWVLLGRPYKKSEITRCIAFAAMMTTILWVVFEWILNVEAPGKLFM